MPSLQCSLKVVYSAKTPLLDGGKEKKKKGKGKERKRKRGKRKRKGKE